MSNGVEVTRRGRARKVKPIYTQVNAIDIGTSRALGGAFGDLRDHPGPGVGILTAKGGRIRSAGQDLKSVNSGGMALDSRGSTDCGEGHLPGRPKTGCPTNRRSRR